MENMSLEEYKEKMSVQRRMVALASAILKRAKDAGIPEQFMRINEDEFASLLCTEYHGNPQEFASSIFKNANGLFKKSFIQIDGGTIEGRKRAGFALLFRMMACDKGGKYETFKTVAHSFSSVKDIYDVNRNELVVSLSNPDVLFLSEFDTKDINVFYETGSFLDELFEQRENKNKTTIISFSKPLDSKATPLNSSNAITTDNFGQYMVMLSKSDLSQKSSVLRVRVKE
jgi:hypothetical protein